GGAAARRRPAAPREGEVGRDGHPTARRHERRDPPMKHAHMKLLTLSLCTVLATVCPIVYAQDTAKPASTNPVKKGASAVAEGTKKAGAETADATKKAGT